MSHFNILERCDTNEDTGLFIGELIDEYWDRVSQFHLRMERDAEYQYNDILRIVFDLVDEIEGIELHLNMKIRFLQILCDISSDDWNMEDIIDSGKSILRRFLAPSVMAQLSVKLVEKKYRTDETAKIFCDDLLSKLSVKLGEMLVETYPVFPKVEDGWQAVDQLVKELELPDKDSDLKTLLRIELSAVAASVIEVLDLETDGSDEDDE